MQIKKAMETGGRNRTPKAAHVIALGVAILMIFTMLLPQTIHGAESYDVTITTLDITNGDIGGIGKVAYYDRGIYQSSGPIVGNTINVSIDPGSTDYRLRAQDLPNGYRFVGWMRVKSGQTIDEGEYIHPYRQDVRPRDGQSFYVPEESGETLYAVYRQTTNLDNKVGVRVYVKDEDGNPVSGVIVGVWNQRTDEKMQIISGSDGKARTAPGLFEIITHDSSYPEIGRIPLTTYLIDVPEGYILPQEAIFRRYVLPLTLARSLRYLIEEVDGEEYYYGFAPPGGPNSSGVHYGDIGGQELLELTVKPIPTGGIRLIKQDSEDTAKALAGAEFRINITIEQDKDLIKAAEDWVAGITESISNGYVDGDPDAIREEVLGSYENDYIILNGKEYHNGEIVATVTTDTNGIAETDLNLPTLTKHGQKVKYSIVETKAPEGYSIDKPEIAAEVDLTENDYQEYTVTNTKKREEDKPNEPDKQATPTQTGTPTAPDAPEGVQTGDDTDLMLFACLIVAAGALLGITGALKRRND